MPIDFRNDIAGILSNGNKTHFFIFLNLIYLLTFHQHFDLIQIFKQNNSLWLVLSYLSSFIQLYVYHYFVFEEIKYFFLFMSLPNQYICLVCVKCLILNKENISEVKSIYIYHTV